MREPFVALPRKCRVFIVALVFLYLAVALWSSLVLLPYITVALVGIFALAGLVRPVSHPLGGISDPITTLAIAAALMWEPAEVLLGVGLGSFIGLLLFRKNELWRAAINGAGWGIPAATAAASTYFVGSVMGINLPSLALSGVLAIAINRVVNTGIFAVYRSTRFGRPFVSDWAQSISYVWPNQFLAAPLAVVLAYIGRQVSSIELELGLTFLAGLVLPVTRQEYAYYISSQKMLDEIVEAMVRALEGIESAAREHGDRVSTIAVEAGRLLEMPERSLTALRLACRLHDVSLLAGPEEGQGEGSRAVLGGQILRRFPDPLVAEYVAAHLERWDGTGVPNHLSGKAIPLGARILSASEIYDRALSGQAPFDSPLSPLSARSHLISLSGTVLDPTSVMAVLRAVDQQRSKRGTE
jgi:hypothetical protein